MDRDAASNEKFTNMLTLPTELLVFIVSFLSFRDIVKLRYVSRRLRSVCETPSLLLRELIWPHLDVNRERRVKSLLKSSGRYVKRLSFPYCVPLAKLKAVLQHCNNIVELSIPNSKLNCDQLRKVLYSMEKLQSLYIAWTSHPGGFHPLLMICSGLNELKVRMIDEENYSWLDKWVMEGLHPQTLKIVVQVIPLTSLVEHWLRLNPRTPTGHTGFLKLFSSLKVPMDLYPPLPEFQLQFGQSCTLPFVKPSKCGLFGLEERDILLTNSTYGGEELHKAVMSLCNNGQSHLISDIFYLSFVTQFVASNSQLCSGHLEQLAMACPNLHHLDIQDNQDCLKRLQGLREICVHCRNLNGLNIQGISEVENHFELWKVLVDMRLIYLAIEQCILWYSIPIYMPEINLC